MSDDHEFEPLPGIPEPLPKGEKLLWQSEPDARVFAKTAFFSSIIAIYFLLVTVWQGFLVARDNGTAASIMVAVMGTAVLGIIVFSMARMFGYLYAKTTVYSITNQRVIMRFGLAIPLNVNLPLKTIQAASVKNNPDGSGDISFTLELPHKVSYVQMWPCVQRWHLANPRPAIRAIPNVDEAANVLSRALQASAEAQIGESQVRPGEGPTTHADISMSTASAPNRVTT